MVYMALSRRSHENKTKGGQLDDVRCDVTKVRPNYPSLVIIFLVAHKGISLLVLAINRTIGLLWEVSLSHPLDIMSSFF
jgi:hypothetical protein